MTPELPLRYRLLSRLTAKSHALDFWERDIRRYERPDEARPAPGAIVFTGSSTIRLWSSLPGDMAPLRAVNRGFGGALARHVTHNFERLIVPLAPRAVVLYAGDNDLGLTSGLTLEDARRDMRTLVEHIHARLPGVTLVTLGIKPSRLRRRRWPEMRALNQDLTRWADELPRQRHIELAQDMFTPSGEVDRSVLRWDGLHLNAAGYARVSARVRPLLCAWFPP